MNKEAIFDELEKYMKAPTGEDEFTIQEFISNMRERGLPCSREIARTTLEKLEHEGKIIKRKAINPNNREVIAYKYVTKA